MLQFFRTEKKTSLKRIARYLKKIGWTYELRQGESESEEGNVHVDEFFCKIKVVNDIYHLRICPLEGYLAFVMTNFLRLPPNLDPKFFEMLFKFDFGVGKVFCLNEELCVQLVYPTLCRNISFYEFHSYLMTLFKQAQSTWSGMLLPSKMYEIKNDPPSETQQ